VNNNGKKESCKKEGSEKEGSKKEKKIVFFECL
jgi:hypothetical protein